MSNEDFLFYHRRERQERIAAKQAASLAARCAHQELAARYSALLMRAGESAIAA
jgi:hypothetical protein